VNQATVLYFSLRVNFCLVKKNFQKFLIFLDIAWAYTVPDDCPELTDEQLAEFQPVNGMTWEERTRLMREAGSVDDADGYWETTREQELVGVL
jgi:hypothetical protein